MAKRFWLCTLVMFTMLQMLYTAAAEPSISEEIGSCEITNCATQEQIAINSPAIIERIVEDLFSPVDFTAEMWSDCATGETGEDWAYVVEFFGKGIDPVTLHNFKSITIQVKANQMAVNGQVSPLDEVTLYMLQGLFQGLRSENVPAFSPLN